MAPNDDSQTNYISLTDHERTLILANDMKYIKESVKKLEGELQDVKETVDSKTAEITSNQREMFQMIEEKFDNMKVCPNDVCQAKLLSERLTIIETKLNVAYIMITILVVPIAVIIVEWYLGRI